MFLAFRRAFTQRRKVGGTQKAPLEHENYLPNTLDIEICHIVSISLEVKDPITEIAVSEPMLLGPDIASSFIVLRLTD